MIVPFGAVSGHSLSTGLREVAAYYAVSVRAIKRKAAPEARDALCWHMITNHGWQAERLAHQLRCSARAVRDSVKRHADAIALFRETHSIKGEASS